MSSLSDLILPRLPLRPLCTDNLGFGLVRRAPIQAIDKPYIQLNPPVLMHWLLFDIDRRRAAFAWEDAYLPPPNWATINKENGHAHLAYCLIAPVLTTVDARAHPLRFAAAIEEGMRLALKADSGYAGTITKNPLHERWRTLHLHSKGYELNELAEYLELPKCRQPRAEYPPVGLSRNVTLFDEVRAWAYKWVLQYKQGGACLYSWAEAVLGQAERINQKFENLLSYAEVRSVARSVAKWVWRTFTVGHFREIQRIRGRLSGARRRQGSVEEARPWDAMGVSRRTYYNRKKAGKMSDEGALEPCQIPSQRAA